MLKRILSSILIMSLSATVLASCTGKDTGTEVKQKRYIDSDNWWNDRITDPDLSQYPDIMMLSSIDVATEEYYVAEFIRKNEKERIVLCKFDYDGILTGSIVPDNDKTVGNLFLSDGVIYASCYGTYEAEGSMCNYICRADFDKSILVPEEKIDIPSDLGSENYINDVLKWNGKIIYSASSDTKCSIVVDGTMYDPVLDDGMKVSYINNMKVCGDTLYYEAGVDINDTDANYICSFDLNTHAMHARELEHHMDGGSIMAGGVTYYVTHDEDYMNGTKIVKYDPASDGFSDVLKFTDTYINNEFGMSPNYNVLYADDSRVTVYSDGNGIAVGNGLPSVITLSKASSNPNKGREVLELGCVSLEPYSLFPAVNKYNRESDKYYIEVTGRYAYQEDAVYTLMEDIKGGTGPDMVLLDSANATLADPVYLRDLSGYTGNNESYYRIDYCRTYRGLIVRTSLLDDPSSPGITYERYIDIVKKNNGSNPLGADRITVFNNLFEFSADSFFDAKGNIDLDNEDFRALAEYVRDMPEPDNVILGEASPVTDLYYTGFPWYLSARGDSYDKYTMIGYPSRNGDKPVAIVPIGIGVTSCSSEPDVCVEFARSLLDPEVQSRICEYNTDPVSTEGLLKRADKAVDELNVFESGSSLIGSGEWPREAAGYYLDQLSDAVYVRDVDATVLKILDEELEPYIAGQKDIDEVIRIATNRVELMMKER